MTDKNLLIVNSNKDISFVLKKKISSKIKILTLSPNLFCLLKNSNLSKSLLTPNHFFKKKHHKLIIKKLSLINKKLENDKSFEQNERIYLRYLFQIVLSSSFFIWYSLGDNKNWYFIHKNKILKTLDKKLIFNKSINQLFNSYQRNLFGQVSNFNNSAYLKLNYLINKLNIHLLNQDFDIISNKKFSHNSFRNTLILNKANKFYILKNILNIIFNLFKKNKSIEFTPLKNLNTHTKNKKVDKFFKKNLKIFDTKNIIIYGLSYSLEYNKEIFNLFKKLFAKSDIKNFLTDEIKYRESLVLSQYLKKHKINTKIYLASHGTHPPLSKDIFANFQITENSDGLLTSDYADYIIIQSKISDDYLKTSNINNIKKIVSKPISWSNNKKSFSKNFQKDDILKILHASTPKSLCSRPYLYESPYEYIENLNYLINQLSDIQNIKLIIRPRFTPEFNLNTFKSLIFNSQKIELSLNNSFIDDLSRSDALISTSSTTIEEALYLKKPVLIYNCLGYDHFRFYNPNIKDPIFIFNKNDNFKKKFMNIKSLISLNSFNYDKYIWKERTPTFKIK